MEATGEDGLRGSPGTGVCILISCPHKHQNEPVTILWTLVEILDGVPAVAVDHEGKMFSRRGAHITGTSRGLLCAQIIAHSAGWKTGTDNASRLPGTGFALKPRKRFADRGQAQIEPALVCLPPVFPSEMPPEPAPRGGAHPDRDMPRRLGPAADRVEDRQVSLS